MAMGYRWTADGAIAGHSLGACSCQCDSSPSEWSYSYANHYAFLPCTCTYVAAHVARLAVTFLGASCWSPSAADVCGGGGGRSCSERAGPTRRREKRTDA